MSKYTLHLGDCLEILPTLPPASAEAIITDLPYGTTACSWDEIIPFAPMWEQVKRILKPRGVFVTTASQPFTSKLIMSNVDWFRYEWIWDKNRPSGFQNAKTQPMRQHENVVVFSKNGHTYNPQKTKRDKPIKGRIYSKSESNRITSKLDNVTRVYTDKNPITIIWASKDEEQREHPTQKPVALYEYLIKTYTNEGDTVLDFCMGSGTTGVAALKTGRKFIGIEKKSEYFDIARKRIEAAAMQEPLFA